MERGDDLARPAVHALAAARRSAAAAAAGWAVAGHVRWRRLARDRAVSDERRADARLPEHARRLGIPRAQRQDLREARRHRRRVVLQPRRRQQARGARREAVVSAGVLRRPDQRRCDRWLRAFHQRTDTSRRTTRHVGRALPAGRRRRSLGAGLARCLVDRALLPLHGRPRGSATARRNSPRAMAAASG